MTHTKSNLRKIGLVATVAILLVVGVAVLWAVHGDDFQLDADIVQVPATVVPGDGTPLVDWGDADPGAPDNLHIFDAVGGIGVPAAPLPANFPTAAFVRDFVPGATGPDSTTFATGSKDTLNITPGWQCAKDNNVNDKTDIVNAYATAYMRPSDDHLIIYFALERFSNEGDGNVGFWFLQDGTVGCVSNDGTVPFTGNHMEGDVLVVSEFSNGGVISTINAYEWVGGAGGALNTTAIASGQDCDTVNAGDPHILCANVNTAKILAADIPWLTETKKPGNTPSNDLDVSEFYEGGIDLTELGLGDQCFSTFLGVTRSSTSLTATIFDYALGHLNLCGLSVDKDGDALSKIGDEAHYTITITNTGVIPLYKHSIVDDVIGDLTDGTHPDIDSSDCGDSLAPGDSCTIEVSYLVTGDDPDPLINEVTAIYNSKDDFTGEDISDSDDHTVNLFQPSVEVTKDATDVDDQACSGQCKAKAGQVITYHYVINNTSSGDSPDLLVDSVIDDVIGDLALDASAANCDTLGPGDSCNFDVDYTVTGAEDDPLMNIVTVHYHPENFPNDISDSDSEAVDIFQTLQVKKVILDGDGVFDLLINSTVEFTDAGDGDMTGMVEVDAGSNSVAEEAGTDTDLADYSTTVICVDQSNGDAVVLDTDGAGPHPVNVPVGSMVLCTFTNSLQTGNIIVDKVTSPSGHPRLFDFNLGGGPDALDVDFQLDDDDTPFDSGPIKAGDYSVNEFLNDPDTWNLDSANCVSSEGNPDQDPTLGDVTLEAGETLTCTFFNSKPDAFITIGDDDINELNNPHTFTVHVEKDTDGDGIFEPAEGEIVTFDPIVEVGQADCSFVEPITCDTGTDASGNCLVTVNSPTRGSCIVSANVTLIIGDVTLNRSTDGTGSNSDPATKTYVGAQIILTPEEDTNPLDTDHVLTAFVGIGDGIVDNESEPDALEGNLIDDFEPAPNDTLVECTIVSGPGFFVGGVDSCLTSGNDGSGNVGGTCEITIHSADPGTTEVECHTTVVVNTVPLFRMTGTGAPNGPNAIKHWEGGEGCTPGYWKNHLDRWEGYSPAQTVDSVFTIPGSYSSEISGATLAQALSFKGGSDLNGAAQILLRAGVAALLNAANPDVAYPLSEADVITAVNDALASGDRNTILTVAGFLDSQNNLGCPLGGTSAFRGPVDESSTNRSSSTFNNGRSESSSGGSSSGLIASSSTTADSSISAMGASGIAGPTETPSGTTFSSGSPAVSQFNATSLPTASVVVTFAQVSGKSVEFSGTLKDDSGQPFEGVVGATFALYGSEQGGAPLWLESQNVTLGADGQYAVRLTVPAELLDGRNLWLGVQVQGHAEATRIALDKLTK